jgi:hypothetical protein
VCVLLARTTRCGGGGGEDDGNAAAAQVSSSSGGIAMIQQVGGSTVAFRLPRPVMAQQAPADGPGADGGGTVDAQPSGQAGPANSQSKHGETPLRVKRNP